MTSSLFLPCQKYENFATFLKFSAILKDSTNQELMNVMNIFIKHLVTESDETQLITLFRRLIIILLFYCACCIIFFFFEIKLTKSSNLSFLIILNYI